MARRKTKVLGPFAWALSHQSASEEAKAPREHFQEKLSSGSLELHQQEQTPLDLERHGEWKAPPTSDSTWANDPIKRSFEPAEVAPFSLTMDVEEEVTSTTTSVSSTEGTTPLTWGLTGS